MKYIKVKKQNKTQRGGARKGAGRKPGITFKEATVVMRIPVSKIKRVKNLLVTHPKRKK